MENTTQEVYPHWQMRVSFQTLIDWTKKEEIHIPKQPTCQKLLEKLSQLIIISTNMTSMHLFARLKSLNMLM